MTAPAALVQRIGRRGAALLFFTLLDFVICYSLLTAPRPLTPLYAWLAQLMPIDAWAACWGAVAVVCLVFAFKIYDTPAFMCAVGLKIVWGGLAFCGWLDGVERGYVTAVVWLAFAGFVFLIAGGIPGPARLGWRGWPWIRSSA